MGKYDTGNVWSANYRDGAVEKLTVTDANNDEPWFQQSYSNQNATTGEWETINVQQRDGTRDETVRDLSDRVDWS